MINKKKSVDIKLTAVAKVKAAYGTYFFGVYVQRLVFFFLKHQVFSFLELYFFKK